MITKESPPTHQNDFLSQVKIRKVKKKDLPALEWEGEYIHFRNNYLEAFKRSRMGMTRMWLAELNNTGVIGQVFIQLNSNNPVLSDGRDRAYLYSFRIRPEYRNKGLGSYILEFIEKDLIQQGFSRLTLNVAKDNEGAIKLYKRKGYKIIAHEPGDWSYRDHQGNIRYVSEPAWRMEKELVRSKSTSG